MMSEYKVIGLDWGLRTGLAVLNGEGMFPLVSYTHELIPRPKVDFFSVLHEHIYHLAGVQCEIHLVMETWPQGATPMAPAVYKQAAAAVKKLSPVSVLEVPPSTWKAWAKSDPNLNYETMSELIPRETSKHVRDAVGMASYYAAILARKFQATE